MRRTALFGTLVAAFVVGCLMVKGVSAGEEASGPEFINMEKVGKQLPVNFPHKLHGEKAKCDDCHGGDKPLFAQKITGKGEPMKDMYAGKSCG
ncbi:MAG: hypothetical protein HY924_12455, partial [Elusimicrobia bacterium]|nr:hypothetical protein [Elusimicrobiota bacterium]